MKHSRADEKNLHLGCGLTAPTGWLNVDGSWQVRLRRLWGLRGLVGRLGIVPRRQTEIPWPENVIHLNVTKGLPFPDNTFKAIYSSHLIEHLYRGQSLELLKECLRVLKSGGVCRAVVPNLEFSIREYWKSKESDGNPFSDPARRLMQSLHIRAEEPPRGGFFYQLYQRLTDFHTHKWMYDKESLTLLFKEAGFCKVEHQTFLASQIEGIEQVETEDRARGESALCIEGVKL